MMRQLADVRSAVTSADTAPRAASSSRMRAAAWDGFACSMAFGVMDARRDWSAASSSRSRIISSVDQSWSSPLFSIFFSAIKRSTP